MFLISTSVKWRVRSTENSFIYQKIHTKARYYVLNQKSLLVCKSVEVTVGAGAGVGRRRVGRGAGAGAGQTRGPTGRHCRPGVGGVGGVGQSLQSRLLGGLLRPGSRLASSLLHPGLLVPLLVKIPAGKIRSHIRLFEWTKCELPDYLNKMLVFSVTIT